MKVSPISKNSILTPRTTGYAATGALVLTGLTAASKNKPIRKLHKPLGYLTIALTAIHLGLIEYNHYAYKQLQKSRENEN